MNTVISNDLISLINKQNFPSGSTVNDLYKIMKSDTESCTIDLMIKAYIYGEIQAKRLYREKKKRL